MRFQKYLSYNNREERARFIAQHFSDFLKGKILDVGCWQKDLKKYLPSKAEYLGIDITGSPDIFLDLEKEKLPFPDNSFDCVVCADVLEHLDNLHIIFAELLRVSRKYIIISLPNNWLLLKNILFKKNGSKKLKFYGLPIERPKDRHKWFFNYKDAKDFISENAKKFNYSIIICEPYFNFSNSWLKRLAKKLLPFFLGETRFNNLFATALWTVLKK